MSQPDESRRPRRARKFDPAEPALSFRQVAEAYNARHPDEPPIDYSTAYALHNNAMRKLRRAAARGLGGTRALREHHDPA